MIYLTKWLDQIDQPDTTTDNGKLGRHIAWVYENLDAINKDITAAISSAPGIEDSWVKIALDYLYGIGAIVVDGGSDDQ